MLRRDAIAVLAGLCLALLACGILPMQVRAQSGCVYGGSSGIPQGCSANGGQAGGQGSGHRGLPPQARPTAADLLAQAHNNAVALSNQGVGALRTGDYATAAALLAAAHTLWPENVNIWNDLQNAQSSVTNQRLSKPVDGSLANASGKIAAIQRKGAVDTSGLDFAAGSGPGNSGGLGEAPDTGHDVGPARSTDRPTYADAGAQLGGAAASAKDINATPQGDDDHIKAQADCVFSGNGGCPAAAPLARPQASSGFQADAIARALGPAAANGAVKAALVSYKLDEQDIAGVKADIARYRKDINAGGDGVHTPHEIERFLLTTQNNLRRDQGQLATDKAALTKSVLDLGVALPPELAPPPPRAKP